MEELDVKSSRLRRESSPKGVRIFEALVNKHTQRADIKNDFQVKIEGMKERPKKVHKQRQRQYLCFKLISSVIGRFYKSKVTTQGLPKA